MSLENEIRSLIECPHTSLLARVLDAAPVGATLGVDGKVAYANPAGVAMWGYQHASEIRGRSYFDLIAQRDHEELVRLWRARTPGSTEPWTFRMHGVRRDGSVFPYSCVSMLLPLPDIHVVIVYFVDLTNVPEDEAATIERSLLRTAYPPPVFAEE